MLWRRPALCRGPQRGVWPLGREAPAGRPPLRAARFWGGGGRIICSMWVLSMIQVERVFLVGSPPFPHVMLSAVYIFFAVGFISAVGFIADKHKSIEYIDISHKRRTHCDWVNPSVRKRMNIRYTHDTEIRRIRSDVFRCVFGE